MLLRFERVRQLLGANGTVRMLGVKRPLPAQPTRDRLPHTASKLRPPDMLPNRRERALGLRPRSNPAAGYPFKPRRSGDLPAVLAVGQRAEAHWH